jgi:hypothetical protein
MSERISYTTAETLITAAGGDPTHAIEQTISGINRAEETITTLCARLRGRLDDIETKLAAGHSMNELGELNRDPAELDMAIAARMIHWRMLGFLVGMDLATALSSRTGIFAPVSAS